MLEFKKIELEDHDIFEKYLLKSNEQSCEASFINLFVWENAYNNMYLLKDEQLIIKSSSNNKEIFRLPFGDDFEKGIDIIRKYSGEKYPTFFVQDGNRCNEFIDMYGENYNFTESRNSFDYIYLTKDLSDLSGKKYHSKRNHISAFSNQNEWHYEKINANNISKVKLCAEKWYREKNYKNNMFLATEKDSIDIVLNNMDFLEVRGGCIVINGDVVAFTLGSEINNDTFDIHFEKAISDYAEAYTVINQSFAQNELYEYKYINREDDMGIEGLRKAKLSYKPHILLKKYICESKKGEIYA